jgi:hypothetical protein
MTAWTETATNKLLERPQWMVQAICLDHPQRDVFFSERGGGSEVNDAKDICAQCPVWHSCLDYALKNHEKYGVWGGLSVTERRLVRNLNQVKRCPKCVLIKVFFDKGQTTCDTCKGISLRQRSGRGSVSSFT